MSRTARSGGVLQATLVLALLVLLLDLGWSTEARQQHEQEGHRYRKRKGEKCELGLGEAREELRAEGGTLRVWSERIEAFQNAYVGFAELELEEDGLLLPQYSDADKVAVVVEGEGWMGAVLPVSPEYRRRMLIRRVNKDDVIALPKGTVYWWYNDGNRRHRVLCAADTTFGTRPGKTVQQFGLAGAKQERFGSILHGFSHETLARAWGVDEDTVRSILERQNDAVIIRAERKITFDEEAFRPRHDSEERRRRRESPRRRGDDDSENGAILQVSEGRTRFHYFEEIKYDTQAQEPDIYVREGGVARLVNRHKLPALSAVGFSVGKTCLKSVSLLEFINDKSQHHGRRVSLHIEFFCDQCRLLNAMFAPAFFRNAHQIIYITRGNGRIEVSTGDGETAFNEEVREGSVVAIPQFHPAIKIAGEEGLEWINILTSDTPSVAFLAGRNSVYRGIPRQVLANALRVDEETFDELVRGRKDDQIILPSREERGGRRRHGRREYAEAGEEGAPLLQAVEKFLETGEQVVEDVLPLLA